MNEIKYPFYLSIPFIIFINLIFFPIALFFLPSLLRKRNEWRLRQEQKNAEGDYIYVSVMFNNKRSVLLGFTIFFALLTFTSIGSIPKAFTEGNTFADIIRLLIVAIVTTLLVAGITFLLYREFIKNNRYHKYAKSIYVSDRYELLDIATSEKISVDMVRHEIEELIAKGFMPGIKIENNQVVFLDGRNKNIKIDMEEDKIKEVKVYHCRNCGANTTIESGQLKICEFCGSALK